MSINVETVDYYNFRVDVSLFKDTALEEPMVLASQQGVNFEIECMGKEFKNILNFLTWKKHVPLDSNLLIRFNPFRDDEYIVIAFAFKYGIYEILEWYGIPYQEESIMIKDH